jgi:cytochrome c553
VLAAAALAVLAFLPTQGSPQAGEAPPTWLYPDFIRDPVSQDPTPRHVPNSTVTYTDAQIRDIFVVPDWHPNDHPPMPEVVAHGRKPDVRACGYCHYASGQGRPENAPLAGLPAAYIIEQVGDYKTDARKAATGADSRWQMNAFAKAATDADIQAAAEYFSKLTYKPWVKVVESDTVPAFRWETGLPLQVEGQPPVALGKRIIELPADAERSANRDDQSGFVAYVPKGAIARGKTLVETGGGKTLPCGTCHGEGLKGMDPAPPIAGRSPTYVARALFDFRAGARNGPGGAQLMKPMAAGLTLDDMIDIAAYVGSLAP